MQKLKIKINAKKKQVRIKITSRDQNISFDYDLKSETIESQELETVMTVIEVLRKQLK